MKKTYKLSYGSVWQQAADNLMAILESNLSEGEQLKKIMGLGYFSQFTSYASLEFNQLLFSWLRQHLLIQYEFNIESLPNDLDELNIVPSQTLVDSSDRILSPDLLRNVAYALQMRRILSQYDEHSINILEIGSGYGGLGRVLKSFYPGIHYWLTDIPESLRCAEIYLKAAFPHAKIIWQKTGKDRATEDADFYLIPLEGAFHTLANRKFELAINIWSFGEMPNNFIDEWFKLLQDRCNVGWLFTINSFMAPVTPTSIARMDVGDWLFNLDDRWFIDYFEIDPVIHRCPLMQNFPKGIGFIAKRIKDINQINEVRAMALAEVSKVYQEDWVAITCHGDSSSTPDRPERMIDKKMVVINEEFISSRRLLSITDYIGHFNIESGNESTFFRLWNDWRMNKCRVSAVLLVAYLAMVSKANLEMRCTKEELLMLDRLPIFPIHSEYEAFFSKRLS